MRRPSNTLFQMGPEFEITRDGAYVASAHGLPEKNDTIIRFPAETDLQPGDVVIGKVSREEFVIEKVKPAVSGTTILYFEAFPRRAQRDDHSRTQVTQHIGTVHGAVVGRDLHGDVTVTMTVGDVLNYLRNEIEKTASPEEKKTLLAQLGEFSRHPLVVKVASVGIEGVAKWFAGMP